MPAARRPARVAEVLSTEHLTPGMIRIVLGGEALDGFAAGEFTDHYVKLTLPAPTAEDPGRTRVRTYSVSDWDAGAGRLTIDFVVHGDTGVAGPWAAAARPGDTVELRGPGGAYTPDPSADWHLLAGDASVIPAIAAAVQRLRAGTPAWILIEVDGPDEEQPLAAPDGVSVRWLHRSRPPGEEPELLTAAVAELALPAGRGQAFVHGEATSVRTLRRHLLVDRELPADALSASGYWKLRRDEEGWREDKPEWARLAAADVDLTATS